MSVMPRNSFTNLPAVSGTCIYAPLIEVLEKYVALLFSSLIWLASRRDIGRAILGENHKMVSATDIKRKDKVFHDI